MRIARHLPVEEEQDVLVHDVVPGEARRCARQRGRARAPPARRARGAPGASAGAAGERATVDGLERAGRRARTLTIDAADEDEREEALVEHSRGPARPRRRGPRCGLRPRAGAPRATARCRDHRARAACRRAASATRGTARRWCRAPTAAAKARPPGRTRRLPMTGRRRDGAEGCQGRPDAGVLGRSGDAPEGRWQPVHQRRLGEERLPVDPRRDPVAG